jgi:hypothetical protein
MASDRVVYTVLVNGYDALKRPAVIEPGIDYLLFTDRAGLAAVEPPWQPVVIPQADRNPRVMSRRCKLLPHRYLERYEHSLWIDATLETVRPLGPLFDDLAATGIFGLFRHPERDCVYDEAEAVRTLGYESPIIIDLQMACYRALGYPPRNGLWGCNVIYRRHRDARLRPVMEDWWRQLELFSQRDQLSANYVFWKHGIEPFEMPAERRACWRLHAHPRVNAYLDSETVVDETAWLRRAAADAAAALRDAEARVDRLIAERAALAESEARHKEEAARLAAAQEARGWRARLSRLRPALRRPARQPGAQP